MDNHANDKQLQKDMEPQQQQSYTWTYANGRRYPASELGHYYIPNDEPEIQRLSKQHWMLTVARGGLITLAPLEKKDDLKILDIGCGSGIWCLQMSDEYPTATIIGADISPIQPANKPKNVQWVLLDFENGEWPFPENYFDLIHLCLVHGCVEDWDKTLAKIVRYIKPGGYIDHHEFSMGEHYFLQPSGERLNMSAVHDPPSFARWPGLMIEAAEKRGRTLHLGPKLEGWQKRAGLVNVKETFFPMPIGTWPEDQQQRLIGAQFQENMLVGIEGFTLTMFIKALGWSEKDTRKFIEECKVDLQNDDLRKMIDLYVVYGQKPMA